MTDVEQDFQDSKPPVLVVEDPAVETEADTLRAAMLRTPPPNYVVLRTGSQSPERFTAKDDADALAMLQRQVRQSKAPIVYLYKLMLAEAYVPSSETLQPEQIADRLKGTL